MRKLRVLGMVLLCLVLTAPVLAVEGEPVERGGWAGVVEWVLGWLPQIGPNGLDQSEKGGDMEPNGLDNGETGPNLEPSGYSNSEGDIGGSAEPNGLANSEQGPSMEPNG